MSFKVSLLGLDPNTAVFDKLAAVHSVSYLEEGIYKEQINLPQLVIYHGVTPSWRAWHTASCSVKGYQYMCYCNIFDIVTPVCGYSYLDQLNETGEFAATV